MVFTLITTQLSKVENGIHQIHTVEVFFTSEMIGEPQLNFYFLKRQLGFFDRKSWNEIVGSLLL